MSERGSEGGGRERSGRHYKGDSSRRKEVSGEQRRKSPRKAKEGGVLHCRGRLGRKDSRCSRSAHVCRSEGQRWERRLAPRKGCPWRRSLVPVPNLPFLPRARGRRSLSRTPAQIRQTSSPYIRTEVASRAGHRRRGFPQPRRPYWVNVTWEPSHHLGFYPPQDTSSPGCLASLWRKPEALTTYSPRLHSRRTC